MIFHLRYQLAAVAALPLALIAQAGSHAGCRGSTLIPFLDRDARNEFHFSKRPEVYVKFSFGEEGPGPSVESKRFIVDTGTCGIVVSKEVVNFDEGEADILGYQWLSSSKILYVGWWVYRWVWFNHGHSDSTSQVVGGRVRILALEKKWEKCPNWTPADKENCPDMEHAVPGDTSNVRMMGIGFGRMHDGQPQGDPYKNPLLNIQRIGSVWVPSFCPGWIIDLQGITFGLTDNNWAQFEQRRNNIGEIRLGTDPGWHYLWHPPPLFFPWGEMHACVGFAEHPVDKYIDPLKWLDHCVWGAALFDTGLDNPKASIRMPCEISRKSSLNPRGGVPPGETEYDSLLLTANAVVIVGIADSEEHRSMIASWAYETPTSPAWLWDVAPRYTDLYCDANPPIRPPSINTGMHIFRRFAFGFDPLRGRAALAKHVPPSGPPAS
ncbi:hypothetical protein ACKLNR_014152 [Fusarium oxysporum f. sp. zingiberi]